jgi:hypothetical protein
VVFRSVGDLYLNHGSFGIVNGFSYGEYEHESFIESYDLLFAATLCHFEQEGNGYYGLVSLKEMESARKTPS